VGQLVAVSTVRSTAGWLVLLRPKWLCWHLFVVVAVLGQLWLGRWQLHRAESGNELSWAYTFEWPLFAMFTVYFWARTVRDELRGAGVSVRHGGLLGRGLLGRGLLGRGLLGRVLARAVRGKPAGDAKQEETPEAYLARLQAEVRGHGRWHGWR
jgi:hypothetical protein